MDAQTKRNLIRSLNTVLQKLPVFIIILTASVCSAQDKPNVIFVFADQMRNQAIGINQEDPTLTPRIDDLAREGIRFRNAISSCPVCTPFRGMLISGKFPLNTGITRNCSPETPGLWMRPDSTSFGNVFKSRGYQTGYIGKWHLDDPQTAMEVLGYSPDGSRGWDTYTPPGPKRQGFDFWHAYNAYDQHLAPHYWENSSEILEFNTWSPEHEMDVAMNFIENRDPAKPFLLVVSMNPPHPPATQVPDSYRMLYDENDILLNRKNVSLTGEGAAADDNVRNYFAAVSGVDDQFGRLIDYLKQEGLFDNTILVFSADHGEMMGSHGRMNKSNWYEEAINIPLIVTYPRVLEPGVSECLVSPVDFLPSLLGLAGLNIPKGYDGKDLSTSFLDASFSMQDTVFLAGYPGDPFSKPDSSWLLTGWRGIRTTDHTFVARYVSGVLTYELYDLIADKWQLKPLVSNSPQGYEEFAPYYRSLLHSLSKTGDPFLGRKSENKDPYNLIENPDFEYASLEGWNSWNNSITNAAENVYQGSWSGVVSGGTSGSLQQSILLKPNTDYRLSLQAKMSKPGESAVVIVNNYGGTKIVVPVEGTEYAAYEIDFRTANITEPVLISFYKSNAAYDAGYCDNFRLVETGDLVSEIALDLGSCSLLPVGESLAPEVYVFPQTALNKSLTWTIHNITGEAVSDGLGKITALQPGLVEVQVSANDASGISTTFTITVVEEESLVQQINILPSLAGNTIQIPDTVRFSVEFEPDYICDQSVTWSVRNISGEGIISPAGVFRPLGEGEVELTATSTAYPEFSGTISLDLVMGERHTYYVDASTGNDSNDGLATSSAWKSLEKVNSTSFLPGDSILFKAGQTWSGQLEISSQGAIDHPVVFSRYGEGPDPRIDGNGEKDWTLLMMNSNYTEARDFELTNTGASMKGGRYGAMMHARNEGPVFESVFRNLSIHDVNGDTDKSKGGGGGIVWKIEGDTPSRFVDALIEDCHIYDCERNGIVGKSAYTAAQYQYKKEYYSLRMTIRRNLVERIPGDGIVALGCDSALVEYNICRDFTDGLPDLGGNAAAGIWPWNSHNTVIQYNEVSGHQASWDAQGFDSDYNCDGTIIQYNYSHDNAGGFILICSNGQWDGYNDNTIVRYNISVNDGYRTWGRGENFCPTIHIAGNVYNTKVYNNTFYSKVKPGSVDRQFIEATNWNGLPNVSYYYNNIFYAEEAHGFKVDLAKNNDFSNNFYSANTSLPSDDEAITGDPMFMEPGTSDIVMNYRLQAGSPAIGKGIIIADNGGLDFFGNEVPADSEPAIGAHQPNNSGLSLELWTGDPKNEFVLFPNPVSDTFLYVKIKSPADDAKLVITSLNGRTLYVAPLQANGESTESIDLSGYRKGMYIVSLHSSSGNQSERFILY